MLIESKDGSVHSLNDVAARELIALGQAKPARRFKAEQYGPAVGQVEDPGLVVITVPVPVTD